MALVGEEGRYGEEGGSKGDETVGVCNCNGFNALLMADGTRDWGNGLHQMSLLAGERRRCRRNAKKRGKRYIPEDTPEEWKRATRMFFSPS